MSDLPSMRIERVERSDGVIVHGRFDRLDGVREAGWLRVSEREHVWGDLSILDPANRFVLLEVWEHPVLPDLTVGASHSWFDARFQAPLVEAILDKAQRWRRFHFEPKDAVYFRDGTAIGWQKKGGRLPEGATPLGVKPGGWDHLQCDLCGDAINAVSPIAYDHPHGVCLCVLCYETYAAIRDVSFQLRA